MIKNLIKVAIIVVGLSSWAYVANAAPTSVFSRTILPEITATYDLGSASKVWNNFYTNQICLSGDCQTSWPAGGGGSGITGLKGEFQSTQTGATQTLSTSTSAYQGLTPNLTITSATNKHTFTFSLSGTLGVGGGGTGVGTFTSSQLIYGNGTNALTSVATSTLTASSPLSLDQPVVKVGGTNSILSISTAGTWSGNAGTATALAANGTNCSAGNYPLGVDASGNVESCTAANLGTVTSVGLSSTNSTLTIGATPVTGSGTITADLNLGHANAWTALQSFALSSTTLASITSKLYVGGTATTTIDASGNIVIPSGSNLTVTGKSDGCATWATGVLNSTGVACGSGGSTTGLATSSPVSGGNLLEYSAAGAGSAFGIATTTLGFSGPFNGYASIGTLVGGSNTTLTWTGLATTSQPSSSNLLVSNGGAGVYGVATTSTTCASPLSCGAFNVLGGGGAIGIQNANSSQGGALTSTDWNTFNNKQAPGFQIATTSGIAISQLAYYTNTGTTIGGVATSTLSCTTGVSCTSTTVIGTASSVILANINANSVLGNTTGASAAPTSLATSSLYTFSPGFAAGNTLQVVEHASFSYSTTSWVGTTTQWIEVGYGEVFNQIRCSTDAGTVNVDVYHASSHLNLVNASTTIGAFSYTTNNTITSGDLTKVDIGTPASSPTRLTCTLKKTI